MTWLGWLLSKFVSWTTNSLGSLGSKQQLDEMVNSLSSSDKCYGSHEPWSNITLNLS
jgi:hypothetical protein